VQAKKKINLAKYGNWKEMSTRSAIIEIVKKLSIFKFGPKNEKYHSFSALVHANRIVVSIPTYKH
jgi:hypothetical protein